MSIAYIDAFTFAIHVILLLVKVYAVYVIAGWLVITKSPNSVKRMVVFRPIEVALLVMTAVLAGFEIYFLQAFFLDLTDAYYYEYLAMIDQIVLTLIMIRHYLKEKSDGN